MVAHQKRKKSCVKKSRVVSAVPGSNKVVVFCVHGCGISYTTVPMHVDKPAWHKTLRKLNAHESQRCPKNAACQRCPRKHPRVRASSTANPVVAADTQIKAGDLTHSAPPAPPVHKHLVEASSLRDYAVAADEDFWGCSLENVGAELEAQELEGRLSEESQLLLDPGSEASVVTGVYWTQPTENRDDTSDAYNAEVLRRLSEPVSDEEMRRKAAHDFVRRVFPEFQAKLERMRARGNLSGCWGTAATRVKRGAPLTSAESSSVASSSLSSTPANASVKKRQRHGPAPASPAGLIGQIDLPDVLTLKAIPWGLGQQVSVHSAADGGRCEAHIVGIGGYQGSSVLLQFFAPNGSLRQQLHNSSEAKEGERARGCNFDESTKISDFAVQQLSDATNIAQLSSCPAGTAGRKLAPLQCDDLLASLDEADAKFDDIFGSFDSPLVVDRATDLEVSPDFAALFPTAPTSISCDRPAMRTDPHIFDDFDNLTDDEEEEEEEEDMSDEAELREFTSAMQAIEITSTKTLSKTAGRALGRVKRPSITDYLKMDLAAANCVSQNTCLPSWAHDEELLLSDSDNFSMDTMAFS